MKQISATKAIRRSGHYDANYGNFQKQLYEETRREAFGEDIGQNSWLTTEEHDRFLSWLDLTPGRAVLDIACGAGGPALRMASVTGCAVIGVDVHEQAIATACSLAAERDMTARSSFVLWMLPGDFHLPEPGLTRSLASMPLTIYPSAPQLSANGHGY
jgi:2-polyprenyl-3-methyl-5-hydroxy-6-metoxy-1,4-benzoquinol methylase